MFGTRKHEKKVAETLESLGENRAVAERWAWAADNASSEDPSVPEDVRRLGVGAAWSAESVWTDLLAELMVIVLETIDSPAGSQSLDTASQFAEALSGYPDMCLPSIGRVLLEVLDGGEPSILAGKNLETAQSEGVRPAVSYFCTLVAESGVRSANAACLAKVNDGAWEDAIADATRGVRLDPLARYCTTQAAVRVHLAQIAYTMAVARVEIDPTDSRVCYAIDASDAWLAMAKEEAIREKREDVLEVVAQVEAEARRIRLALADRAECAKAD